MVWVQPAAARAAVPFLRERAIQQRASRDWRDICRFPFDEELLSRCHRAVSETLRIAAREQQLRGAKKALLKIPSWLVMS